MSVWSTFVWGCVAKLFAVKVSAIWTDCSNFPEDGELVRVKGMPKDFWNEHVRPYSKLDADTGASLDIARFFLRSVNLVAQNQADLEYHMQSCLFGLLTVLLQALPAVEYEGSEANAINLMFLARDMMAAVTSQMTEDQLMRMKKDAESSGWNVEAIFRTMRLYESLFGNSTTTSPGSASCHGNKVFVYPPPPFAGRGDTAGTENKQFSIRSRLHHGTQDYLSVLARRPLQCLYGMYGTELILHHYFEVNAPCRTHDPDLADFFFVPSYFKCIEVLNYFDNFNPEGTEADTMFQQTISYVQQYGPWFEKRDAADHIFVFSWGRFPCRLKNWRERTRSGIFLQVENNCEDLNSEGPHPSFNRWKDIIIPGHIDQWRVVELMSNNQRFEDRDLLLVFHGRYGGNAESYENVSVRNRIVGELDGLPGVSVGGFVEGYHGLMGRSKFCLAPRGITPWTIHLYVAMFAGCIPVILSDDFEVPFQHLDWPSFSIKWPMTGKIAAVRDFLLSLSDEAVRQMKASVDANACWFNYYSDVAECSPYAAVLQALSERRQQRPAYLGRFWSSARPLHRGGHGEL